MLSAVYPNPANAVASFNYSIPAGSQGTVIIRNLVGATVQTEQLSPGAGVMTISTAGLAVSSRKMSAHSFGGHRARRVASPKAGPARPRSTS